MKRSMWLGGAAVVLVGVGLFGIVHFLQGGPRPASQPSTPMAATKNGATPAGNITLVDTAGQRVVINPNEKTVLHFLTTSCADCLPTETALAQFQNDPHGSARFH
ncbi:MAG: hypothetical protein K6T31_04475 [Alicyclobacillus sp.]|nr:hypothetical protein [Alicyclobacillus sp.]